MSKTAKREHGREKSARDARIAEQARAPAQHHLRALISRASFHRSVSGSGPFGTAVPCRVHANIAFLSGPARVRLPAGPPSRALVLAPLSVARPDPPKSVESS